MLTRRATELEIPSTNVDIAKTLTALGLIVGTSLLPTTRPVWFLVPAFILLILATSNGMAGEKFASRLGWFFLAACVWGSAILLSFGWLAWQRTALVVVKSTMAFGVALWLSETVPPLRLLGALRRLHVPKLPLALFAALLRQLGILRAESRRMLRAKAARTFQRAGIRDWPARAGLVGLLFVRSIDRAERTHRAMLARGWTGELDPLLPE